MKFITKHHVPKVFEVYGPFMNLWTVADEETGEVLFESTSKEKCVEWKQIQTLDQKTQHIADAYVAGE